MIIQSTKRTGKKAYNSLKYWLRALFFSISIGALLPSFGALTFFPVYAPQPAVISSVNNSWYPFYFVTPDSICQIASDDYLHATEEQLLLIWKEPVANCSTPLSIRLLFIQSIKKLKKNVTNKNSNLSTTLSDDLVLLRQYLSQKSLDKTLHLSLEINLGVLEVLTGQNEKAKERFLQLNKIFPHESEVQKNLFSLYILLKSFQKADELLESALQKNRKLIWAQERKLFLIKFLGSPFDLRKYMEERVSWQDSLFAIQIAYGLYLKSQGEARQAIKYLERGLEGAPDNGSAWLRLGELYHSQGDIQRLEVCIKRAFEVGVQDPFYFKLGSRLLHERVYEIFLRSRAYERRVSNCEYRGSCIDRELKNRALDVDSNLIRIKESAEMAFSQGPGSRSLAYILYWVYGGLGDYKSQEKLKSRFPFHFFFLYPKALPFGTGFFEKPKLILELKGKLKNHDF